LRFFSVPSLALFSSSFPAILRSTANQLSEAMAPRSSKPDLLLRKFGAPLYAAAFPAANYVLVGGGGGKGNHGLKNRIILAKYGLAAAAPNTAASSKASPTLSDQLAEFTCPEEIRALAMHPSGSLAVAAVGSLGLVAVGVDVKIDGAEKITKTDITLPSCGEVKSLAFSADGAMLAAGTEDGLVHVWSWPPDASGRPLVEVCAADGGKPHKDGNAIQSVCFSTDGARLLTSGEDDTAVLWNIAPASSDDKGEVPRAKPIHVYRSAKGGTLKGARFASAGDAAVDNRIAMCLNRAGVSYAAVFDAESARMLHEGKISADPASSFAASANGRLLAFGTVEGELVVVSSDRLILRRRHKGAHMIFVTGLVFGPSGDTVLSVSADAGARVTQLAPASRKWTILLIFMLWLCLLALSMNPAPFHEGVRWILHKTMPYHAKVMDERTAAGIAYVKYNHPDPFTLGATVQSEEQAVGDSGTPQ